MRVRATTAADDSQFEAFLAEDGSSRVARRGESSAARPPDADRRGRRRAHGLLTYVVTDQDCEILTLHATEQWAGAGSALVAAIRELAPAAAAAGCGS